MQSFAVGGLCLVLAAGGLRLCHAKGGRRPKELGVLQSTQSGGTKPPQTIKLKKLKLTKYICLGIY